jgi:hypothetical protein
MSSRRYLSKMIDIYGYNFLAVCVYQLMIAGRRVIICDSENSFCVAVAVPMVSLYKTSTPETESPRLMTWKGGRKKYRH